VPVLDLRTPHRQASAVAVEANHPSPDLNSSSWGQDEILGLLQGLLETLVGRSAIRNAALRTVLLISGANRIEALIHGHLAAHRRNVLSCGQFEPRWIQQRVPASTAQNFLAAISVLLEDPGNRDGNLAFEAVTQPAGVVGRIETLALSGGSACWILIEDCCFLSSKPKATCQWLNCTG